MRPGRVAFGDELASRGGGGDLLGGGKVPADHVARQRERLPRAVHVRRVRREGAPRDAGVRARLHRGTGSGGGIERGGKGGPRRMHRVVIRAAVRVDGGERGVDERAGVRRRVRRGVVVGVAVWVRVVSGRVVGKRGGFVDEGFDLLVGFDADEGVEESSAGHEHDGREALDAQLVGHGGVRVDVDLDEGRLAAGGGDEGLELRGEGLARAAPVGVKVKHERDARPRGGGHHLLELRLVLDLHHRGEGRGRWGRSGRAGSGRGRRAGRGGERTRRHRRRDAAKSRERRHRRSRRTRERHGDTHRRPERRARTQTSERARETEETHVRA